MMRLPLTIARRYLFSRREMRFVSVISLISIVGVTVGVAALIVILSVFNGFNGLVTSILVSFDPHVRVEAATRSEMPSYEPLLAELSRDPAVAGYAPFVGGKALAVARNSNRVIFVKGMEEETIGSVSGLREKIVLGALDFGGRRQNGILLGLTLADRLGAVVGDTVSLISPTGTEAALMQMAQPLIRRFHVAGIYETNNKDYDGYYAFIGLEAAQSLFSLGSTLDGYDVRLRSVEDTETLKDRLEQKLGPAYRILTWYDLHRDLYSVMQIERWMAFILLSLIVCVAAFYLLGSLTMSVIEKTRDIGILKSFGATTGDIVKIFLIQGTLVGVIGSVLGVLLGIVLVALQEEFHLFPLDPTVYIISAIPVDLRGSDILLVSLTSVLLCSLASLYPARRAARLMPAEAIRWE